jgi:hypothetical protein
MLGTAGIGDVAFVELALGAGCPSTDELFPLANEIKEG